MAKRTVQRWCIAANWHGARVWVSHIARDGRFLVSRQREAARTMTEATAVQRLQGIARAGIPAGVNLRLEVAA